MKQMNRLMRVLLIGLVLAPIGSQVNADTEYVVMPSEAHDTVLKAEEDWQNISDAISTYSDVRLAPGDFYLPRSIVLWNPDLVLKGSGRSKTTVRTAPDMAFEVAQIGTGGWTSRHLFVFPYDDGIEGGYEGYLSLSDMTIVVDEPAVPYDRLGYTGLTAVSGIFYFNANVDYGGAYGAHQAVQFDAHFHDLRFLGTRGDPFIDSGVGQEWYQPNSIPGAIVVWGPAVGNITVERVSTQYAGKALSLYMGRNDSNVVIGGGKHDGCGFWGTASANGAVYLETIGNVMVAHNSMDSGIWAWNISGSISENTFIDGYSRLGGLVMLWAHDTRITNNTISDLTFANWWRAGISLFQSDNNIVAGNILHDLAAGTGGIGVALWTGSNNNLIAENDLIDVGGDGVVVSQSENWVVENELEDIGGNGIYLLPTSANNLVQDNKMKDISGLPILDQGSGNTVSGNKIKDD
jgi:parallel beta-helix repeat protein